jgi:hypothetical protein
MAIRFTRRRTVNDIVAESPYEHMSGEQDGEQTEQNWAAPSSRKPNESGPLQRGDTPSLRLGAGRSQVQILSPRYEEWPANGQLLSTSERLQNLHAVPSRYCFDGAGMDVDQADPGLLETKRDNRVHDQTGHQREIRKSAY